MTAQELLAHNAENATKEGKTVAIYVGSHSFECDQLTVDMDEEPVFLSGSTKAGGHHVMIDVAQISAIVIRAEQEPMAVGFGR